MKLRYIFVLLLFLLMFACNENNTGIFYGLKYEEKIKDNSLPNNVTVGSMAKVVTNNRLYIAAGNIYTKTSRTEEEWVTVAPPSGYDLSVNLVTSDGTDLYAIYYTKKSAKKGLFSLDVNTNIWSPINISSLAGTIEDIKTANNEIFVSTRIDPNNANIYHYTGGTPSFDLINFPDKITGSAFNVIYTGIGDYWISNYNNLYKGSISSSFTRVLSLGIREEFKGLENLNDIHICYTYWNKRELRGYIGVTDGAGYNYDHGVGSFMLNGFKYFTITDVQNKPYLFLICATAGRGYYQVLEPTRNSIDLQRPRNNILSENYNSAIDLQDAVILDFFIDGGDDGDLYALTATRGLWKNSDMGGYRNWSIE